MLEHKDHRVKLTSEVLQGIRTVKFSSWESFFAGRIGGEPASDSAGGGGLRWAGGE